MVFEKVHVFVPRLFGETLFGHKWCTLFSAQLQQNKKTQKTRFFCSNLAFAVKQQRPDDCTKPKNQKKKHNLCTLVFLVSTSFSKVSWWCLKKKLYFCSSVVRIARPASLAIWHRGRSHRRPNRSESPNRRHFASLNLKKHADFSHRRPTSHDFRRDFSAIFLVSSDQANGLSHR